MTQGTRAIPPYAEPVKASALRRDDAYFMVTYIDDEMFIPTVRTLIFLGKNVDGERENQFYFQDADSYFDLGAYPQNTEGAGALYVCPEKGLSIIFTLDKAMDNLARCLERRSRRP